VKALALVVCVLLAFVACEREQRRFSEVAPSSGRPTHPTEQARRNPAERNAWAISQGKQLYDAYNCSGCHANGGGGMGPALMDAAWLYGSEPEDVYASIVEGRPNGMPAFGGRIPDQQVWQLVAYVRSMSAQTRFDVRPGRRDHMRVKESELARRPERPVSAPAGQR
jgi:cytochrome c oxidase cbb3-type subunit III